jgi:hypothetical protein
MVDVAARNDFASELTTLASFVSVIAHLPVDLKRFLNRCMGYLKSQWPRLLESTPSLGLPPRITVWVVGLGNLE